MRAGRSRSRSEERGRLVARFYRIQAERRGGKNFRRRYRKACLDLLEYLVNLITWALNVSTDQYHSSTVALRRRLVEVQHRHQECVDWHLPLRSQPLLHRFQTDPEVGSEVDSIVAETVAVSDEDPDDGPEVLEPVEPTASGIWGSQRASPNIRITRNNPLLRSSASSASSSRVPLPSTSPRLLTLPPGVSVEPLPESRIAARIVLSIDWHQVLDTLRLRDQVERPRGYYILPQIISQLQRVKQVVPGVVIVVNSYCHSQAFRIGVLSIPDTVIDYRIVTDQKCGPQGKLQALLSIFDAERFVHCDDNIEVCDEFLQRILSSRATDRPQFNIVGIRVPRRWRQQRGLPVEWKGNILDAIASCFNLN